MQLIKNDRSYTAARWITGILGLLGLIAMAGCGDGSPTLFPNGDPALRKTSAKFAADAAKRHYEADAPNGGNLSGRAQYGLMLKQLDLVNLSNDDWTDVEVWVNHTYVVFIPKIEKQTSKVLPFGMLFDSDGNHLDTQGGKNPIKSVEVFKDGKMYIVIANLAD